MPAQSFKNIDLVIEKYTPGYDDTMVLNALKGAQASGATVWLKGAEPWVKGSSPVSAVGDPEAKPGDALIILGPRNVSEGAKWAGEQALGEAGKMYSHVGFLVNQDVGIASVVPNAQKVAEQAESSWRQAGKDASDAYRSSAQYLADEAARAANAVKLSMQESTKADELLSMAKMGGELSRNSLFFIALGNWVLSQEMAPRSSRLDQVASVLENADFVANDGVDPSSDPNSKGTPFESPREKGRYLVGQILASIKEGNYPHPGLGQACSSFAGECQDFSMIAKLAERRAAALAASSAPHHNPSQTKPQGT